jgi:tetratricopeptide (TPR) repeat protein
MTLIELFEQAAHFRSTSRPDQAIELYAQAFIKFPDLGAAYTNYGNVIREMGFPERAIRFLQCAIDIDPDDTVAQFNLAVAYLLSGDLTRGWPQYEKRWQFEHLNGLSPKFKQPRWSGENLHGKRLFISGEQGHGDNIQFSRFITQLEALGTHVIISVEPVLKSLIENSFRKSVTVVSTVDPLPEFDYWISIMSIPGILKITYENLPREIQYINASKQSIQRWQTKLDTKTKLRVGFCWSGRRDSWINQHKSIPFENMIELIKRNPEYEWINLQADCSQEQNTTLINLGLKTYPASITNWDDTAGLIHNCDVVVAIDTAVAHLTGAMGQPLLLPLNQFGNCWRWLLHREDSPWYPSCRIFRQPTIGNWDEPLERIHNHLKLFKI